MDRWTRLGIEAYRAGNREQAQRFFHYALIEKPDDIRTWLWLVEVADQDAEKKRCLTRVLALDPNHVLARRALDEVEARVASKRSAYVDPFEQAVEPVGESPRRDSAVEIPGMAPFVDELAQQNAKTPSLETNAAQPVESRRRGWPVIIFFLAALVVLVLLLAWSLHLFGG